MVYFGSYINGFEILCIQKEAETPVLQKGAVQAVQDLYDVVRHDVLSINMRFDKPQSFFFPCFWSFILGKYVHLSCILQGKLWDVEFVIKSEDRRSFVFEVEVAQRCWAGLFGLHSLSLFKLLLLHSAFYSIEDSVTLIHLQKAQVKRLHSLLTIKDSASNIPRNLEARRRLEFFTNSLFMDMPPANPAREMLSFWYTSILHASILYLCIWSIYLHV